MTILSTLLSFFPALVILMVFTSFIFICIQPSILCVAAFLFSLYIFPLLIYKLHEKFYPLQEGISYLVGKNYSPWWGSHQIQVIYITFPALEAGLRLIPGAFSLWLRLWGAKVGKGVYWTPHLEISDRALLEIGNNVVFGHKIGICSHIIKPKKQDLMLYVKRVKIGSNVFLGAGSYIGPGVQIADGTFIGVGSHIYPNQVVKNFSSKAENTQSIY
ncbi:acyl transferase [Chlorogloeopsis sp. ULAP01]|uniref:acyl transferase n=1 Tax=Chlorogloeopsis sp. ULAP01 TaxID=3056483 RepID=UPI0025AA4FB2|nr:acyl transferase [Chlorogloeopsis sp. ULAP01]MDM9382314.1 acyl transferase [Chlorogloeopsis sp. ULAP01]